MDFLLRQSPAGRSAPWSTAKQQFTAALQLLQARLEHNWHEATFSFGQGLSLQIGKQMPWDCGFAPSRLTLIECSWYPKVHHRKFFMKHLQEDKEKQVKNKSSSLSRVFLLLVLHVWFSLFVHFILGYFSYSDQTMRILNNCKMGQQENSVGLHSFKLNYLNSANEKQQHTIIFNSVCCDFYKNV